MGKYLIITAAMISLFLNAASGIISDNSRKKNILVLFSYVPSTPAYRIISEGIHQKLSAEFGDSYNLHLEYLETENFPKGRYPKEKFSVYNKKYADVNLDLLICVGVDIISTVKDNADDHLKNLPSITIDFDFSEYGLPFEMSLNMKTAIIGMKLDAEKTISEALEIFPGTSSLYFICGISRLDSLYMQISKKAATKVGSHIKVIFLSGMTMDEILKEDTQFAFEQPDNCIRF